MTTVWTRLLIVLALVLAGALVVFVGDEDDLPLVDGLPVIQPGAEVHGRSMAEWSARHWQWTLEAPLGTNPGLDVTGEACGDNQTAPVFLVPRNFPPCQVPSGWNILVPIAGIECSTAEAAPYHGYSPDELEACATRDMDRNVTIVVRVDGELVPDMGDFRTVSPPFTVTFPERNVLGVPAGEATAVADGYQLMLAPLSPGEHEVMVHVELGDGTVLPDKVLQLTVLP